MCRIYTMNIYVTDRMSEFYDIEEFSATDNISKIRADTFLRIPVSP